MVIARRGGLPIQSSVDDLTGGRLGRALARLNEFDTKLLTYVQAQIELSAGPCQTEPAPPAGLGRPVTGESVPRPGPPADPPDDGGSGPHGARQPSLWDRLTEQAAYAGAASRDERFRGTSARDHSQTFTGTRPPG